MADFVDLFCGAGGSTQGLTAAGFVLRLAANHWERAIETHAANFRDADHVCADINNYDMRRLPRTTGMWGSPICTEGSPAGGNPGTRAATAGQLDLLADGPVEQKGFERTRATFHDIIRATEVHRYEFVLVENVPEVATRWELFDWWVGGMRHLGYNVQYVSVSSAHIGGANNLPAPQWRDRLYLVFTREGIPLPDVDPRPLALCVECGEDVRAVQSWRKPGVRRIGRYRRQYDYRCPNSRCRHALVEPYVAAASSIIDWTDLGTRIGDREAVGLPALKPGTLRRIRAGLDMFAEPTMVAVNHNDLRAYPAGSAPLPARTVKIGDGLACPPFIAELRGGGSTARLASDPLATVTAGGNHHGLTIPPGAHTSAHHRLVVPYRKAKTTTTGAPLHTLATRDSAALVRPAIDIAECHFRMLQPREALRAQRFPDTYTVTGNRGEQTMQAGNAVSANVAQWLGERVAAALDGRRHDDADHPGEVAA